MSKKAIVAVLVCALLATSSLVVTVAYAQTIFTPFAPDFTLRFVDNSYDNYVFPVSSTNPYTGTVTTVPGFYQHFENKSIELIIRNQPSGYTEYYNISVKGHYASDWVYYYYIHSYADDSTEYLEASNTARTVIVFGLDQNNGPDKYDLRIGDIPPGGELDFRVQAYYGYLSTVKNPSANVPFSSHSEYIQVLTVTQTSNWSNTQTITIPEPSPSESVSPSPSPTTEPTSPTDSPSPVATIPPIQPNYPAGLPVWLYAVVAVMALAIGVLLGIVITQRKNQRKQT
jgi:hypothetical protein